MINATTRLAVSGLALMALTACMGGGEGGGGGGDGGPPVEPTDPPDEVIRDNYPFVSDRTATGSAGMVVILLEGQTVRSDDGIAINYNDGLLSGGDLAGLYIDDSSFSNPANGEYSRVFLISGSNNLFGVVGLDVPSDDLPATGTVTNFNEGWVGMQAIFEDRTLTLEGDATFTATWGTGDLSGRFFNLSGQDSLDQQVTNVGTIVLTGSAINADRFEGGSVTGTGDFAALGATSSTDGTEGIFFGPLADELGGVLLIDDMTQDIRVIGVFQAD